MFSGGIHIVLVFLLLTLDIFHTFFLVCLLLFLNKEMLAGLFAFMKNIIFQKLSLYLFATSQESLLRLVGHFRRGQFHSGPCQTSKMELFSQIHPSQMFDRVLDRPLLQVKGENEMVCVLSDYF